MHRRFQIEHADDPLDPVTIPVDYIRVLERAGPWAKAVESEIQSLRVGERTKPQGNYAIRRIQ
jgi:hypothetical protein